MSDDDPLPQPGQEMLTDPGAARDSRGKFLLVIAVTIGLFAVVIAHVSGINGSPYHIWNWGRLEAGRIYPAMLLAAIPFVGAQVLHRRAKGSNALAILLLMGGLLLMQLAVAAAQSDAFDLSFISDVVKHPLATSYYTDADYLANHRPFGRFLAEYPGLMQFFSLHSRQKPPGWILYYYLLLKSLPADRAALVGGILTGLISTAAIPATYVLIRQLTSDRSAAFAGASYPAICPSMVLFFPTFDIIYPAMTCAILVFWLRSLGTGRPGWAVLAGLTLGLALFMAYNLLVLGALMIALAVWQSWQNGERKLMQAITGPAAVLLGTVVAIYSILYLTTGFNPIATFTSALRNQHELEATFVFPRPFPQTLPTDIQDFLLGSGWISLLLVMFWLMRRQRSVIVLLALGQIILVACTGLLRCETARVWAFMLPLLMIPIGLELARWSPAARMGVFACLWLLTTALAQNMKFLLS